jgi:hypothetical protein
MKLTLSEMKTTTIANCVSFAMDDASIRITVLLTLTLALIDTGCLY